MPIENRAMVAPDRPRRIGGFTDLNFKQLAPSVVARRKREARLWPDDRAIQYAATSRFYG